MKIVINIPDSLYEKIQNLTFDELDGTDACMFIRNGTPLPKRHGRLIDVSEYFKKEFGDAREFLDKAATIIEADKAESDGEDDSRRN